ncbi:hypothetical protein Bca4012_029922 [Brassica carinata]|uniref:NYN domain-containing protein n=1 Tax=Brassica carinata TaxID=52824 RepID=A0A8X7RIV7_BRACI|nr:hypothetical protein Bca52824_048674 [Brassica carinata]
MKDCPIPEGYDAGRVRVSLEAAFKERGYSGPVSISAYGDQTQTPGHILQGLVPTGISVAHTRSGGSNPTMPSSFHSLGQKSDCLMLNALLEVINPTYDKVVCVTENWGRNYKATPEFATAKIQVWCDMMSCPIPEGYDARRVRPSLEAAFKELGYSVPVSITAYGDHNHTPLQGLSSTGVDVLHVVPGLPKCHSCSLLPSGSGKAYLQQVQRKEEYFFRSVAVKVKVVNPPQRCIANCATLVPKALIFSGRISQLMKNMQKKRRDFLRLVNLIFR